MIDATAPRPHLLAGQCEWKPQSALYQTPLGPVWFGLLRWEDSCMFDLASSTVRVSKRQKIPFS